MSKILSPDFTKKHIEALPANQGGIGLVADGSDIGVQGSVKKDLTSRWSLAASGEWFKDKGRRVAIWLNWQK